MTETNPNSTDAGILVQLAQFAETDLILGPTLLPGFSPFFTVPFPAREITSPSNVGQAYFASGVLPSAPNTIITLLALGLPWPSYLNQGGPYYTNVSQSPVPYGGSSKAMALATPVKSYAALRERLWFYFSNTVPDRDLWIIGAHLGGVMAQLAAADFQPDATGPKGEKGPTRKPTLLTFSTPPSGNKDFATLVSSSCKDAWTLQTMQGASPLDTFPGAPIPVQQALIGTSVVGQTVSLDATATPTGLPVGGSDTWIERTSSPYATALEVEPLNPGTLPGIVKADAEGFDATSATVYANLVGAVYNLAQGETADTGLEPYAMGTQLNFEPLPDSGQSTAAAIWGATFTSGAETVFALRDVISWIDLSVIASHGSPMALQNISPFNDPQYGSGFKFANVHAGVLTLFEKIWPQVKQVADAALAADSSTQFTMTGHGLGGSLAYMLAQALIISYPDGAAPKAYLFGAANFGDYSFKTAAEALMPAGAYAVKRPADFMPQTYFNPAPVYYSVGAQIQLLGRATVDDPFSHSLSSYYTLLTQAAGSAGDATHQKTEKDRAHV